MVGIAAADEAQLIERELSPGLWMLETTVTAAPLLGLLGTITGMMHAFNLIGNNGLVDPTGVTAGVAQALIATALGLLLPSPCSRSISFRAGSRRCLINGAAGYAAGGPHPHV